MFNSNRLMAVHTGCVTREAPLEFSLTLLHTTAAAFMNNKQL